MKDGKVLFTAAWIAMTLVAGAARGDATSRLDVHPSQPASSPFPPPGGPATFAPATPDWVTLADLDSARECGPFRETSPATHGPADVPSEPASMGLFGIGITGLITLRRFRKYFS